MTTKRGVVDPVTGITDGAMRTKIKSVLRPIWRNTSRKQFLNRVRVRRLNEATGKQAYHVQCCDCKKWMPTNAKERRVKRDGSLEKKAKSVYEVDHVNGITPIEQSIDAYFNDLIYGEMEVVCVACHKARTANQRKKTEQGDLLL